METILNIDIRTPSRLDLGLRTANRIELQTGGTGSTGTRNYNNLVNQPQINGITLSGNKGVADLHIVSENTTEGWEMESMYVPKRGEICLFSDTNRIKVGDGSVPIVDLPFIGAHDTKTIMDALQGHINDTAAHVSAADRQRWDNKLNYSAIGETLVLNRS